MQLRLRRAKLALAVSLVVIDGVAYDDDYPVDQKLPVEVEKDYAREIRELVVGARVYGEGAVDEGVARGPHGRERGAREHVHRERAPPRVSLQAVAAGEPKHERSRDDED